ncbi:hypothetical protein [Saccharolobus islandicus]|uniref:Uncharacterized protein n=1 Tax=Saccharolobus islandicus (strain L.D.8.5 / Lassen \|nr:hypothetical protein [Sulfolobus islandicus]ADB86183.1 conserved hypothetical protein [Sulfolobus islandicus L.D.8.5]
MYNMAVAIFNMIVDGEINVKNVQKFFDNLMIAAETLSKTHTIEPLKSLYEKYRDEVKELEELKGKDDIFYFSYLVHKVFDDYFNNGKLKGLLDEISKIKIDKKELLKKFEENVGEIKEDENLKFPVLWTFKTYDLLSLMKKFNSIQDREFEAEYMGLKVYVTIKPFEGEIGLYDPFVFFTKNRPRLGIRFGEIAIDPYEVRILQLYESREHFILPIVEKTCGKLTLKTKTALTITDPLKFKNTAYLTRALRYSHWTLRTSKLSLSEVINYLPFILNSVNKPKSFIKSVMDLHDRMEEEGVDLDYIKKEIETLGWYGIELPNKPIRREDRGLNKLKELYDLSTKLEDPIVLLTHLLMTIIYVYKVNGYEYKQLFVS